MFALKVRSLVGMFYQLGDEDKVACLPLKSTQDLRENLKPFITAFERPIPILLDHKEWFEYEVHSVSKFKLPGNKTIVISIKSSRPATQFKPTSKNTETQASKSAKPKKYHIFCIKLNLTLTRSTTGSGQKSDTRCVEEIIKQQCYLKNKYQVC